MNSATNIEITDHGHFSRPASFDEIVENLIDDILVKHALRAKRPEIELQRLELDAQLVGYIADPNGAKVRLSGTRANTSEFRTLHMDFIVARGPGVWKSF